VRGDSSEAPPPRVILVRVAAKGLTGSGERKSGK
jgi:hypothetical protein